MLRRSSRPPLIFLPRAVQHNPPANPNVVVGWKSWFQELPECELRDEAALEIREQLKPSLREAFDRATALEGNRLGNGYRNRLPNRLGNGSPNRSGNRSGMVSGGVPKKGVSPPSDEEAGEGGSHFLKAEQSSERNGYPNGYRNGYPNGYRNQDQDQDQEEQTSQPTQSEQIAQELRDSISTHSPDYTASRVKPRNLKSWATAIDRLLRLDKADPKEVLAVIRWIHKGDPDNFWRPNILSGKKLRAQWPTLRLQANQKGILKVVTQASSAKEWLTEHGEWLLREGQRLEATEADINPGSIQTAAKRDGIPVPTPEVAAKAANWASSRL